MPTLETSQSNPAYGATDRYQGEQGQEYFARFVRPGQNKGAAAADHNGGKFRPYVRLSDTVLDFGCGGGFVLSAIPCARRLGVEINPAARQHAEQLGIECFASIAEVPSACCDVIISHHALEHVPYPIEALRELRDKLKPGGRLVLCVPIDDWRRQRRYRPNNFDMHLHTWTAQLLGNTLYEAGYRVREIHHLWLGFSITWQRYTRGLERLLPGSLQRLVSLGWGTLKNQRQLLAIAEPDLSR